MSFHVGELDFYKQCALYIFYLSAKNAYRMPSILSLGTPSGHITTVQILF